MLHQFTWQQFLIASFVLSLIWYLAVILIFYRQEFARFFKKRSTASPSERLPHRWENDVDELRDDLQEEEIMGRAKLPEGMSSAPIGSFGFVQSEADKEIQIGLVPDVLQELKEIFKIIGKEDGDKKDFFNLMEMAREKFPKIGSNPNIVHINQFISDHAPFYLSQEELENLWD